MEKSAIEEFTRDGNSFLYIDFSGTKTNEQLTGTTKAVEEIIKKYPPHSVYTITNCENVRFDSETKEIMTKYMEYNKPYVKSGAVIGLDGIIKVMSNTVLRLSGRENLVFAFTKEQAVELLLKKKPS